LTSIPRNRELVHYPSGTGAFSRFFLSGGNLPSGIGVTPLIPEPRGLTEVARLVDVATDEALIRAHLKGSETAFERILERHAAGVASTIERLVGDHHLALDLAQEVFIKLHHQLPRYRFKGRFRSLLYGMALNRARDALREKKRSRLVFFEEGGPRPDRAVARDPADVHEQRALIEAALDRVPNPFREALVLVDRTGLSYREAARALGCRLGTVRSRVSRGRLAFREHYTELLGEEQAPSNQEEGHHAS